MKYQQKSGIQAFNHKNRQQKQFNASQYPVNASKSYNLSRRSWNQNQKFFISTQFNKRSSIRAQNNHKFRDPALQSFINSWEGQRSCRGNNFAKIRSSATDKLTQIENRQFFRFSDFKKSVSKSGNDHFSKLKNQSRNKCENHMNRFAKFYIKSPQINNKESSYYYCTQCSINLSQTNFNVLSIKHSQSISSSLQQNIARLINYKSQLNKQNQQLKRIQSMTAITNVLKSTRQKYVHFHQLINQIEKQQCQKINRIKQQIEHEICKKQNEINNIKCRVQQFINQLGNIWVNGNKTQDINYAKIIKQIQQKVQALSNSPINKKIKIPSQLPANDILKKLESMFSHTVHELSFQQSDDEVKNCANPINNVYLNSFNPLSVQPPSQNASFGVNKKLNRYLFNECTIEGQSSSDYLNFNSTIKNFINNKQQPQQMIEGIDLALSMTGSFCGQQNIIPNI